MSRMTPEQAWEPIRALCPWAKQILKHKSFGVTVLGERNQPQTYIARVEIDWPDGVDRWPPLDLQYREPTQADAGKIVEVRDMNGDGWQSARLLAVLPQCQAYRFVCRTKSDEHCHYSWRQARIAVNKLDDGSAGEPDPSVLAQNATIFLDTVIELLCDAYGDSEMSMFVCGETYTTVKGSILEKLRGIMGLSVEELRKGGG